MRGKEFTNNYMIFALICLIAFNIGTIIINLAGNQWGNDMEAKEVFNPSLSIENEFYLQLLGKTSSIINLYKNEHYGSGKSIISNINQLVGKSIRGLFNNYETINAKKPEELNENNIEQYENSPEILEDIIIIDRLEEYEDLIIIRDSEGKVSLENLPAPLNIQPLAVNREMPYILIYHTHGTESYSSLENGMHHTTDMKYNVTSVGQVLADTLEKKGHKVEHVTTYHDVPSYNESYSQSLKTIQQKLNENSNLKILLDIHRDGFDHKDYNVKKNLKNLLEKTTVEINGKKMATFFFVIGPDSPNKEAVLSFAKYIKAVSDVLYPNLCTGIVIKPVGKYNQFLSDYSALIEIGSNLNTIDEAKETAKLVGEILSMVIENIQK